MESTMCLKRPTIEVNHKPVKIEQALYIQTKKYQMTDSSQILPSDI